MEKNHSSCRDAQHTLMVFSRGCTRCMIAELEQIAPWPLRVWNNLPSQLQQDISYGQFKRQLKTFLFGID